MEKMTLIPNLQEFLRLDEPFCRFIENRSRRREGIFISRPVVFIRHEGYEQ